MSKPVGWCPEHGPVTPVLDDCNDEVCNACGSNCTGPGADLALAMHAALSEMADDDHEDRCGSDLDCICTVGEARKALGRDHG